jgi:hypothetical protein
VWVSSGYIYEQKMAAVEDIPNSVLQNYTVAERISVQIALLSVYCKHCDTYVAIFTELHLSQWWDISVLLIFNNCPLNYKQVS